MKPSRQSAHIADVFRWSSDAAADWVAILGVAIGMAGPVLAGAALGHLSAGLAASLGGMMGAGARLMATPRAQAAQILGVLVPAAVAAGAGILAAGHGWQSDAILIAIAFAAAVFSGFSRALAIAVLRFVPFLIIAAAVGEHTARPDTLIGLVMAGAVWTVGATLAIAVLARAIRGAGAATEEEPQRRPTAAQRIAHWKRTMKSLDGWQYALRLTACLAAAAVIRHLWPEHHLYWIALTVALLVERQIEPFPVRASQRTLGTVLGVVATGPLLVYWPPSWAVVAGLGVLAGARALFRVRNYFAYSIVMTPLVIVILDGGRPQDAGVLIDRAVATVVAAALVIGVNRIFGRIFGKALRASN